jgi:hypothetical protein
MSMRHIEICAFTSYTLFFHIISQKVRLKKKHYWTYHVFWFSLQLLHKSSRSKNNRYSCPILIKLQFSR